MCSGATSAVRYIEDTLDDVEMGSPRRAGAFRTAVLQVCVRGVALRCGQTAPPAGSMQQTPSSLYNKCLPPNPLL
jgi:hypothetical protein